MPTTTDLIKITTLALLVLCGPAEAQPKPNLAFIVIDDGRGAELENPDTHLPNLRALAEQSVTFRNARAPAPACDPSRTALLAGVSPHVSGHTNNGGGKWFREQSPLLRDAITLPEHLSANGYTTFGRGRVFHGRTGQTGLFDIEEQGPYGAARAPGARRHGVANLRYSVSVAFDQTGDVDAMRSCAEFITTAEPPFAAFCGVSQPHLPFNAPQEFFDLHADGLISPFVMLDDRDDLPNGSLGKPRRAKVERKNSESGVYQAYRASYSFADAAVAIAIEAALATPNTIVVLISDHGWHLGSKDHWNKFTLWALGTSTLFMIYDPNGAPRYVDEPVSLMDVYPTLVDLMDLSPIDVAGQSLAPLVMDPEAERGGCVLSTTKRKFHRLECGTWAYIKNKPKDSEELYDLVADPYEWTNLADTHADKLAGMRILLEQEL